MSAQIKCRNCPHPAEYHKPLKAGGRGQCYSCQCAQFQGVSSNPARSAAQYGAAQAVLSGRSKLMPKRVARELVKTTPSRKRHQFAKKLAAKRKNGRVFFPTAAARGEAAKKLRAQGLKVETGVDHIQERAGRNAFYLSTRQDQKALHESLLNPCGRQKRNSIFGPTPVRRGDWARVSLSGTIDGKPATELVYIVVSSLTGSTVTGKLDESTRGDFRYKGRKLGHGSKVKAPRSAISSVIPKLKNPDDRDRAAALFEEFHGRPATKVVSLEQRQTVPTHLADLGRLVRLVVLVEQGNRQELRFSKGVRVGATPDGGQLYLVGGDQELNLKALGLAKYLPKDFVTVGSLELIEYHTQKGFHNFEPVDYHHTFGEEGGELPVLGYDVEAKQLYLEGGSYRVKPEGIVN